MKNEQAAVLAINLQNGESGAYDALYAQLWDTVYGCVRKQLHNPEDAGDAAQDVFTDVYTKIHNLRNPFAFNKWLNYLMMNACRKYNRHSRRNVCFGNLTDIQQYRMEYQTEAFAAAA